MKVDLYLLNQEVKKDRYTTAYGYMNIDTPLPEIIHMNGHHFMQGMLAGVVTYFEVGVPVLIMPEQVTRY